MCAEDAQVTCKREIRTKQETENRESHTKQQKPKTHTKTEGKVRTSGRLCQPEEKVRQGETRGNEFILCAQYIIIRSVSTFHSREEK